MAELPKQLTPEQVEQLLELLRQNNAENAVVEESRLLPTICRRLGKVGKFIIWAVGVGTIIYKVLMVPVEIQDGFNFYKPVAQWATVQVNEYVESALQHLPTPDPEPTTNYVVWEMEKNAKGVNQYPPPDQLTVIPATGLPPNTLTGTQPIQIDFG